MGCTRARGGKLTARGARSRPPARFAPRRLARPLPPASGEAIREGMLGLACCRGNPIPAGSGAQRLGAPRNRRADSREPAPEGVWSRGAARPKRGREEAGERDQRLLLSQRLAFSPRSPARADSRRRRLAAGERGSAWNAGPRCARPLPLPQCGLRAGPEPEKTVPGGPRSGPSPPWGGGRVRGWGGPRWPPPAGTGVQ